MDERGGETRGRGLWYGDDLFESLAVRGRGLLYDMIVKEEGSCPSRHRPDRFRIP